MKTEERRPYAAQVLRLKKTGLLETLPERQPSYLFEVANCSQDVLQSPSL